MAIFNGVTAKDIKESFKAAIRYDLSYFSINLANPIDFWSEVLIFKKNDQLIKPSLLIVEFCLCVPFSSATMERLFSQMNLVKTVRNRLSSDNLNSLRIWINGITLQEFHKACVKKCVHCLSKRKRKDYQKPQSKKAKQPCVRIADLSSSLSDSSSSDCEYSNASDNGLQ